MNLKPSLLAVLVLLGFGCNTKSRKPVDNGPSVSFYVGICTQSESQGIYKYSLAQEGIIQKSGLAATFETPSFLAKNKDKTLLLAVNEIADDSGGGETVRQTIFLIGPHSLT